MGRDADDERTRQLPPVDGPGAGNAARFRAPPGVAPDVNPLSARPPLRKSDPYPTEDLPPGLFPSYAVRKPRKSPHRRRSRAPLFIGLSVTLLVALIVGALVTFARLSPKSGIGQILGGCGQNSPCGVAQVYLTDYTSGNYQAMYGVTSNASRQQFDTAQILDGNYENAQDYIVNRTRDILSAAQIYAVSGAEGNVSQTSSTTATVPIRLVYTSARLGTFPEDITIPLVSEHGQWKVNWTPGLIFPQLDDASGDPHYTRRVRLIETVGQRGTIFDSANQPIAEEAPVWQIIVTRGQVRNEGTLVQSLSTALAPLAISPSTIQTNYEAPWYCGPQDERLVQTLSQQPSAQIQSALTAIPGVSVNATIGRVYPYGSILAPVTGYVQQVSASQLKQDTTHYYENCDLVGDSGVEAWGERYLRPTKGGILEIVNTNADGSDGSVAFTLATQPAANGDDIHTTINLADQQTAMTAMLALQARNVGKGGGSLAVDPTTGEVLEMASTPACDPTVFAHGDAAGIAACLAQPNDPLQNNALQAQEPTGSVFKIVTLSAALQSGVVTPTQLFPPITSYQIPGQPTPIVVDQGGCKIPLTVAPAMGRSCDLIYYQIGVALGNKDPNLLPTMGSAYGFGVTTGIVGMPTGVEQPGLLPDPQYYQQQGANWAPVNSANLAIGQDDLEATPAQVAMVSAAVADNGVRMQPRLVTSVSDGPTVVQNFPATQIGTLPISAANLAVVQAAMETVAQPAGTASDVFRGFPIAIAGKTGTAQACDNCTVPPHAWFTAYAPASPASGPPAPPQIAMSVLILNAGYGDSFATPICRLVLATQLGVSGS